MGETDSKGGRFHAPILAAYLHHVTPPPQDPVRYPAARGRRMITFAPSWMTNALPRPSAISKLRS